MSKSGKTCYIVTLLLFVYLTLQGIFLPAGDEMAYVLLGLYCVLPLNVLICSVFLGKGRRMLPFWLYIVVTCVWAAALPTFLFQTWDTGLIMLLVAAVLELVGAGIGRLIRRNRKNRS